MELLLSHNLGSLETDGKTYQVEAHYPPGNNGICLMFKASENRLEKDIYILENDACYSGEDGEYLGTMMELWAGIMS